jgi:hypothetical protein
MSGAWPGRLRPSYIPHIRHDTIFLTTIPGGSMSKINCASDWVVDIRQLKNLQQLNELAIAHGGNFAILPDFYLCEDKPVRDKLLVSINNDAWDQFLEQANNLGFPDGHEATVEVFDDALAFNPFKMSEYSQRTWEARLALVHQHNFSSKLQTLHPCEKPFKQDWYHLSEDVFDRLRRTGIVSIDDVLKMLSRSPDAALAMRNFGVESLDELVIKLHQSGYLTDG